MGWLIVVGFLLLLGFIPLGVIAQYTNGAARVWIAVGFLRFTVYPVNKKDKAYATAGKKSKEAKSESGKKAEKNARGLSDYLPLAQLVFDFLVDFRKKLQINDLRFQMTLAADDPYNLSVNYGRAWAALGNLMPMIERCFKIKSRKLEVLCDYTAENTEIYGYINMTITVSQLLSIGVYHGIKVLRKYISITKNAKDGAVS